MFFSLIASDRSHFPPPYTSPNLAQMRFSIPKALTRRSVSPQAPHPQQAGRRRRWYLGIQSKKEPAHVMTEVTSLSTWHFFISLLHVMDDLSQVLNPMPNRCTRRSRLLGVSGLSRTHTASSAAGEFKAPPTRRFGSRYS